MDNTHSKQEVLDDYENQLARGDEAVAGIGHSDGLVAGGKAYFEAIDHMSILPDVVKDHLPEPVDKFIHVLEFPLMEIWHGEAAAEKAHEAYDQRVHDFNQNEAPHLKEEWIEHTNEMYAPLLPDHFFAPPPSPDLVSTTPEGHSLTPVGDVASAEHATLPLSYTDYSSPPDASVSQSSVVYVEPAHEQPSGGFFAGVQDFVSSFTHYGDNASAGFTTASEPVSVPEQAPHPGFFDQVTSFLSPVSSAHAEVTSAFNDHPASPTWTESSNHYGEQVDVAAPTPHETGISFSSLFSSGSDTSHDAGQSYGSGYSHEYGSSTHDSGTTQHDSGAQSSSSHDSGSHDAGSHDAGGFGSD